MRLGGIRLATIGGWRHLASKNMLQTKNCVYAIEENRCILVIAK